MPAQEGQTQEIHLTEEDPKEIDMLLDLLYYDNVAFTVRSGSGDSDPLIVATLELLVFINLYALGDRLLVPYLKDFSVRGFGKITSANNDMMSKVTIGMTDIIETIYSASPSNDRPLRMAICTYIKSELNTPILNDDFQVRLQKVDGLAADLLNTTFPVFMTM